MNAMFVVSRQFRVFRCLFGTTVPVERPLAADRPWSTSAVGMDVLSAIFPGTIGTIRATVRM